jgi:hypothetical protein
VEVDRVEDPVRGSPHFEVAEEAGGDKGVGGHSRGREGRRNRRGRKEAASPWREVQVVAPDDRDIRHVPHRGVKLDFGRRPDAGDARARAEEDAEVGPGVAEDDGAVVAVCVGGVGRVMKKRKSEFLEMRKREVEKGKKSGENWGGKKTSKVSHSHDEEGL